MDNHNLSCKEVGFAMRKAFRKILGIVQDKKVIHVDVIKGGFIRYELSKLWES